MARVVEGACVPVEYVVLGMLDNNVYIIGDEQECFVVDPSCECRRILNALGERVPQAIVLTHAHWDHVGAAAELREATGATVIASADDAPVIEGEASLGTTHRRFHHCPVDQVVGNGDVVELAGRRWRVMVTPGHTPGSMCLLGEPDESTGESGAAVLVAGDTLFRGAHGRTDFEGGSPSDMVVSLGRLAQLPADTIVLPGHNATTTIANELAWMSR